MNQQTDGLAKPDTRDVILAAASDMFNALGFRRVSLEDVARHAGVSRRTVYRYFPSREHLISAATEANMRGLLDEAAERMKGLDTLASQIAELAVFTREIQGRSTDPSWHSSPEFAMLITINAGPIVEAFVEFLAPYIEGARKRGEVRKKVDVPRACEWVARMLLSVWPPFSVIVDLDDPDALRDFITSYVVQGLA